MNTSREIAAVCFCCASAVAQIASPTDPGDVWKKAGAGDGLRQAFERTIYSLKDSGSGTWCGENRAQRLTLEFDSVAARLRHPQGSIDVRLNGFGYGEQLAKPAGATLTAAGNRLEYRRGDLTEWYEN